MSVANPLELSENFYINSKRKTNVKIQVKLNAQGVFFRRDTEQQGHVNEQLICIDDIIGSRCGPELRKRPRGGLSSCKRLPEEEQQPQQGAQKDTSAYLYIYAYVKKENPLRRNRTVRILRFRSFDPFEENLKAAERWHQAIRLYKHPSADAAEVDRREMLILLNPKSGSGKGREMFQKQVAPVLQEAEVPYDLHVTKFANFAREFVRTKKDLLQRYRGIVVAAGDGLFYEVLNGLLERTDWQRIGRQLPIGIIPCGSGNGLARSIAHLYGEPYEPKPIVNATLTCVSGKSTLMDVVRVEVATHGKQTEMYSFLSVGWGLIADIDIESEILRSIGAQRFTLWSIHRVISLRTYKGKLYYLPWQKDNPDRKSTATAAATTTTTKTRPGSEQLMPKRYSLPQQEFHDLPDIGESEDEYDVAKDEDEFADVMSLDRNSFRSHLDSWHSATSRRTAYYSIAGQSMRSQRSIASRIEAAAAEFSARAPVHTIPPLSVPLPTETWRCIEGEFIMVHASYTTHLAADCFFAPESRLNDGIIYLVIIRAGVGRSQLAQFLLNMSSGTHLPEQHNEHIQVLPVSAFRIEPSDNEGIIAVDGERVDYGAIQGEIIPGMINVMVPK